MLETTLMKSEGVEEFAHKVLSALSRIESSRAKVVYLHGDLGAGKTTFTKELAGALGIEKSDVNSPTFILKKEYTTHHPHFRKLIHIDAYRFNSLQEGNVLKLEDDLDEQNTVVAIEWPAKMKPINPDIEITFTVVDDDTREVSFISHYQQKQPVEKDNEVHHVQESNENTDEVNIEQEPEIDLWSRLRGYTNEGVKKDEK